MSKYDLDFKDIINDNKKCGCRCSINSCSQVSSLSRPCTCACPCIWKGATGPTGLQGEKGDTGDIGPTGPQGPAALVGIQVQLLNRAGEGIDNNETIIFDNILNQVGSAFFYNIETGEFTILRNGTYLVTWWVSVDGTDSTVGVILSLNMNGGTYSKAAAPPVTSQITGSALVSVPFSPVTLSLTNISGDSITLEDISLQASLVISGVLI